MLKNALNIVSLNVHMYIMFAYIPFAAENGLDKKELSGK